MQHRLGPKTQKIDKGKIFSVGSRDSVIAHNADFPNISRQVVKADSKQPNRVTRRQSGPKDTCLVTNKNDHGHLSSYKLKWPYYGSKLWG